MIALHVVVAEDASDRAGDREGRGGRLAFNTHRQLGIGGFEDDSAHALVLRSEKERDGVRRDLVEVVEELEQGGRMHEGISLLERCKDGLFHPHEA